MLSKGGTCTPNEATATGGISPTLLATMNQLVKKQVKEAKEKEEDNRVITKPYPAWIDSVPYTPGFSQPDLKMFDGTGDPHQHLARFLSRCGPAEWGTLP